MRCFYVHEADGRLSRNVTDRPDTELPMGDVTIGVEYSSLNYKDALAATGNKAIAPIFPHVPGIDAAGVVIEGTQAFAEGTKVIVTGYDLGGKRWGGWSERIRVPEEWLVKLPSTLSTREAMILGTAGFTAAQCVRELVRNEVPTDGKPVVVTGATGGVGCLAIQLLSRLGYQVIAVTGKPHETAWLKSLGASEVVSRNTLDGDASRPLLAARFAAAIDTVGGSMLETLLKCVDVNGCVAACGMVAGTELSMTVYPFILRGVRLAGITSALCPMPERQRIWQRLAVEWKLQSLEAIVTEVELDQLNPKIDDILVGNIRGRVLVRI